MWMRAATGSLSGTARWPLAWLRANPARALVFAILIAYALAATIAVVSHWHLEDAGAYWNAAERLRAGEPLYFSSPNLSDSALYCYAPWFAAAWVPLSFLPRELVMLAWAAVLLGAAAYLIWPDWRSPASVSLSLLVLPDLLRVTSTGNVQGLMLATLAWGLRARWGPVAVGVAASLKLFPLLFAGLYLARREWRKLALAVALAVVLWLPAVLFDLSAYPHRVGFWSPGTLSTILVVVRLARR
jgi:hypothetical protein